ncbi:MAG: WYL domain-containing protein, partial [Candidatus Hydrothermarchaeaceae archaeon]
KVYQDFLTEALSLLTLCEGTYDSVSRYLNISKYMVEFAVATLLDYLGEEGGNEKIEPKDDLVVIYSDFSGTRVSRATSVIMSRVGESIAYQVCSAMNYLTAWNFVRALKERLVLKPGALVVFVTDGEKAWVDPIRSFFPEAVHIRQFHSESSRGLVYLHFPYGGKLYTLRCLWDAVLESGVPSDDVLRMRRRRKLEKSKKEKKADRTELYDGVILWEGVVYEPRGVRKKKGATVSGAMKKEENLNPAIASGNEPPDAAGSGIGGSETFKKACRDERDDRGSIAPATVGAKRIFQGGIEDAFQIPAVEYAYSILVHVFGGLYITSNAVECLFNVKPGLRYHRTVKSGDALVHVLLYLKTQLRKKSRAEIKSFFRDVVSFERLRRVAVRNKGPVKRDKEAQTKQTVLDAYSNGEPVVISYRDARWRRTSRMIEPLGFEVDPYTGMVKVKAYCYLRDTERTFLMDRIDNAIPMDPNLSIVA